MFSTNYKISLALKAKAPELIREAQPRTRNTHQPFALDKIRPSLNIEIRLNYLVSRCAAVWV